MLINTWKVWFLGFRVWREIEKEFLLVGSGKNLKSLAFGFRVWREIEKRIVVSVWWPKLEKSVFGGLGFGAR